MDTPNRRKIIHIDMDAFYASVEQRDNPQYRGRPLVVGGAPDSRGVVATCSYEARRFGIHSAMPAAQAYRLCPEAIFVRPRFEAYRAESRPIREIFHAHAHAVEPLSLDEAYLDVTGSAEYGGSATRLARAIKREIFDRTGLRASAGVSYNKFLAKIASDMDKPDGLYVIPPDKGASFVLDLPVARLHGVGPATQARMRALGIETGADLLRWSLEDLKKHFGKAGGHYFNLARGVDERPVMSQRVRKSLGSETTFSEDLGTPGEIEAWLVRLAEQVLAKLFQYGLTATTLTIKVKYTDFRLATRSWTRNTPYMDMDDVRAVLPGLIARTEAGERPVRLLGVTFSGLAEAGAPQQYTLL